MTARANIRPRNVVESDAERLAATTQSDGDISITSTGVYAWDQASSTWRGGGGVTTGYWVSPVGSAYAAPYTSIQAAITAAETTGNREVVLALPGNYGENITLSTGRVSVVGLAGGLGGISPVAYAESQVNLSGNVHIAATSGYVNVENISIAGVITEDGLGVPSTLTAHLRRINIFGPAHPPAAASRVLNLVNSGANHTWLIEDSFLDAAIAGGVGTGDHCVNATGSVALVFKRSRFAARGIYNAMYLAGGGTLTSEDCEYDGPISTSAALSADLINTKFVLDPAANTTLITGFAGSVISFHGYLYRTGLSAAGTIVSAVSAYGDTDFGPLQTGSLPAAASDGAKAYATNMLAVPNAAPVYAKGGAWYRMSDDSPV